MALNHVNCCEQAITRACAVCLRNSRQLQPSVALRVGFQFRRKGPKNKCLNDECRCQTEGPSDQKPTGVLFHVAVGYRSEQHAFGSNEQNGSVVRWKTEGHIASRTCPNGSRVVAVREAELARRACERPPHAHYVLSRIEPPLSSQDSPRCRSKAHRRMFPKVGDDAGVLYRR